MLSHAVPVVQATQPPLALQTFPVPQVVPAGWLPFAVHSGVPVEQDRAPVWQRSLGWHELPSAQDPQVPLLQTFPLPQSVPLAVGLHVPVVHELHVPQAVLQQIPEAQCPFWHWLSTEQAVPSAPLGLQDPDAQ